MADTNHQQKLEESVTRLIQAYRLALEEGDKSDILTRAEVTRSVIDSGQALANRLVTRVQGADILAQKLEHYVNALHADDIAGKAASVVKKGAAMMGITAGVMLALALNLLGAVYEVGFMAGPVILRLLAYPLAMIWLIRLFHAAYKDFSTRDQREQNPSQARAILSHTVDPVEQQVYALIGGRPPARTFHRVGQGGAIIIGVILFVFVWGFVTFLIRAF